MGRGGRRGRAAGDTTHAVVTSQRGDVSVTSCSRGDSCAGGPGSHAAGRDRPSPSVETNVASRNTNIRARVIAT